MKVKLWQRSHIMLSPELTSCNQQKELEHKGGEIEKKLMYGLESV